MEFGSLLTMTGLIATIFGMVFALAAFITSRRKQIREMAKTKPVNLEEVVEQRLAADQLSAAKDSDTTDMRTQSVFKKIGPQGLEMTPAAHYADDEYIWE